MDENRQKLEDTDEEAEFKRLFDDFLTDLGAACEKAFEQAKARGEVADIPPEEKDKLLNFITDAVK